nr:MAG TPA: hypothetical protein [Caudoviricetes sp.]
MNSTVENLQAIIEFTKTLNFYVTAYISSDLEDDFEVFIFGFYFKIQNNKIERIEYDEYANLTKNKRSYFINNNNDKNLFLNLLYKRFDVKNKFPEVVI